MGKTKVNVRGQRGLREVGKKDEMRRRGRGRGIRKDTFQGGVGVQTRMNEDVERKRTNETQKNGRSMGEER
jgi:hypothetical protein